MPEIKSLADYYNPAQTVNQGINLMQMLQQGQAMQQQGQRLAIENTRLGIEQERMAKATAFTQFQNAFKAAHEDPNTPISTLYELTNKGAELYGLSPISKDDYMRNANDLTVVMTAPMDSEEFQASFANYLKNSPTHAAEVQKLVGQRRAEAGMGELATRAGLPNTPNAQAAYAHSAQLQGKLGEAMLAQADTPDAKALRDLNIAKTKKINTDIQKATKEIDFIDKKISLIPFQIARLKTGDPMERGKMLGEVTNALTELDAESEKAYGIANNPDAPIDEQRAAVDQLRLAEDTRAVLNAQKDFLQDGTDSKRKLLESKIELMQAKREALLTKRNDLGAEKLALAERNVATRERAEAHKLLYEGNLVKAQAEFGQGPLTAARAAKIAAKNNVLAEDVLKAGKDPNTPLVRIEQKQETAESGEVGKRFAGKGVDLMDAGQAAGAKIAKLNRMEQLMQGIETGKLQPTITELEALGQTLGFKVDKGLGAKQALQALSSEVALELRNTGEGNGMPGQLSDKDREFLVGMTPGLAQTPEGNRLIIETRRELFKRQQVMGRIASEYRKKNGHFDEGLYDTLQEYADKHPLFKDKALPAAPAAPTGGGWSIKPLDDGFSRGKHEMMDLGFEEPPPTISRDRFYEYPYRDSAGVLGRAEEEKGRKLVIEELERQGVPEDKLAMINHLIWGRTYENSTGRSYQRHNDLKGKK